MKKIISLSMTTMALLLMFGGVVNASGDAVGKISGSVNKIIGALSFCGYAIAIAMLCFVGVKYAMSPANEKADVKQGTINYLIGAFLIICASSVAMVFVEIATGGTANPDSGLAGEIIGAATTAAGVTVGP